jgi:hypothetical protein
VSCTAFFDRGGLFSNTPSRSSAPAGEGDLQTRLEEAFGSGIEVRQRHASADACLRAVRQARHLDRIPLTSDGAPVPVEVWVPDVPADLPALRTESYGWVAFARDRSPAVVITPPDPVWVYVVAFEGDQTVKDAATQLERRTRDDVRLDGARWDGDRADAADPVAVLRYPPGQWAVPATSEEHRKILEVVLEWTRDGGTLLGAVASATMTGGVGLARRPLAAARGSLLAVEFAARLEASLLPTYVVPALRREAIWLVVRTGRVL